MACQVRGLHEMLNEQTQQLDRLNTLQSYSLIQLILSLRDQKKIMFQILDFREKEPGSIGVSIEVFHTLGVTAGDIQWLRWETHSPMEGKAHPGSFPRRTLPKFTSCSHEDANPCTLSSICFATHLSYCCCPPSVVHPGAVFQPCEFHSSSQTFLLQFHFFLINLFQEEGRAEAQRSGKCT